MSRRHCMQSIIKCDQQDKPGKNEIVHFMRNSWTSVIRDCPDCDRKRTTVCRDPVCQRTKPTR
jgi:hypothetical protein